MMALIKAPLILFVFSFAEVGVFKSHATGTKSQPLKPIFLTKDIFTIDRKVIPRN